MRNNITILILSLIMALPMYVSAQDKTFDFYYIAHDYNTRVESICDLLEERYEMALDNEDRAVIFYLPNGDAPFIVKMNLPGDNRRDFESLLEELRVRYTHDSFVYVDLQQILDLFNKHDYIDDNGNHNFRRVRISWLINSSFWSRNFHESLISTLYFVLELDKYPDYVTMDIWNSGDEKIRINKEYPFGTRNLTGKYPFYLLNL